jgi:hypothetical protein
VAAILATGGWGRIWKHDRIKVERFHSAAAGAVIVYFIYQHRAIALVLVDQLICCAGAFLFFIDLCLKLTQD